MKKILSIGFDLSIMIVCSVLLILFTNGMNRQVIDQSKKEPTNSVVETTPKKEELRNNPIDFEMLQKTNPDLYAWIAIPNTNVDYPIAQSSKDEEEDFYLHKDVQKNYSYAGTIYTQKVNHKDFKDPVTLIYGHSMLNKTMFGSLHQFRKKDFFDANRYIYIYTKGHRLTYEVYAAYTYDDRLIPAYFDFSNEADLKAFFDEATSAESVGGLHRDIQVTTKDKVIVLSTCIGADSAYRFLVHGKLVKDQKTK
ncbi:MAG: class B sortase [Clostridia bacterium]|nr:class B sortase [Clostridia bacterium]